MVPLKYQRIHFITVMCRDSFLFFSMSLNKPFKLVPSLG